MSVPPVTSHDAARQATRERAFSPFQVDHLLLLIGENPLPNYVAARTLLKVGGTPHLVYTKHTKPQADRLRDLLKERSPDLKDCQYVFLDNYESDSYHIQKGIQDTIKRYAQERLGLNYTGGTKPMATHAYRALLKIQPHAIFSYLDPRKLEMCIDREDGERFHEKVTLELPLTELFQLHNLTLQSPPTMEPTLPNVAQAFTEFYQDKSLADSWRKWCDNTLRPTAREGQKWLSEIKLQSLDLPLAYSENSSFSDQVQKELPDEIKAVLQKHFGAGTEVLKFQLAKEQGAFQKYKHLCEWLDGIWLEHYTLQQVQSIAVDSHIHDSALSFPVKNPKTGQDKFELDVAFMRNYQLFAISCTTDDNKGLCKSKLFEAYLRAKQLGGDEARVALVCCSDRPDALKQELEVMLEDSKIKVFGREHLSNLADEITAWINQLDREAK